MGRSGYTEDVDDPWPLIRWRGAVTSAIRGRRGQQFLRVLAAAMDATPEGERKLITEELVLDGQFCTLGLAGHALGLPVEELDPEDIETVAEHLGIAPAMAKEVVYENDEGNWGHETPEERWQRMRSWVRSQLLEVA